MNPTRLKILLGLTAVMAALLVWNWISGWGLVTVHEQGQPLSKIIRSIERQGGVKIVTNAPGDTPVTMDVERVPAVEAVDVLAARLDANWSVGYIAGPTKAEVAAGIAGFAESGRNRDFRSFGGGGGGMMDVSITPIDSRLVVWNVSESETSDLQSYLNQLSAKTGLMAMVPDGWNPDLPKAPKGGRAGDSLRDMVRAVKGQYAEVFVLRVSNWDREGQAENSEPNRPQRGTDGGFAQGRPGGGEREGGDRGDNRREFRPEWMEERALARIAQLPAGEREQARKDFQEMRTFMEQMRELPETERRAAAEKFFSSPAVQERMSERMAERDERAGPERRAERARRYIERKQSMKNGEGDS